MASVARGQDEATGTQIAQMEADGADGGEGNADGGGWTRMGADEDGIDGGLFATDEHG
jgi:hypothetical protein